MMTVSVSRALTLAFALGATALTAACTVYEDPHPRTVVEYREAPPPTVYYEPAPAPPPGVALGVHIH